MLHHGLRLPHQNRRGSQAVLMCGNRVLVYFLCVGYQVLDFMGWRWRCLVLLAACCITACAFHPTEPVSQAYFSK
jgi:hypothetical protein